MALIKLTLIFACCFVVAGCHRGPTSQQAFLEAYRSAYNSGNKDAVLALVKWDGVPPDLRKTQEFVLLAFIGGNQITSIKMIPFAPDPTMPMEINGRKLKTNLGPMFWLIAENSGHMGYRGGESKGTTKCAVGIEKGVYHFCGIQWAEP